MSDRQRILDKIQKCLALAKSANAHEAAAAMRQAQKLMQIHQIDLSEVGVEFSKVEVPIQVNKKKTPEHLVRLVNIIQRAFAVRALYGANKRVSDWSYEIEYIGPPARVKLATYCHVVVFRAMENAYKEFSDRNYHRRGERGLRVSFYLGFLHEVANQVSALGWDEGQEDKVGQAITVKYGETTSIAVSKNKLKGSGVNGGIAAGREFELNRPMETHSNKLEHF